MDGVSGGENADCSPHVEGGNNIEEGEASGEGGWFMMFVRRKITTTILGKVAGIPKGSVG